MIDDVSGRSVLCVSTLTPEIREKEIRPKCEASKAAGLLLATRAQELGIAFPTGSDGRTFYSIREHDALVRGTLMQLDERIRRLEAA